jgi:dTDP-4-dehydrorhamnose 3,5-epimerase-like enzyme
MQNKKKQDLFLKPYFKFEDKRGSINGIFNNYNIQEANLIISKPKTSRGKHYHKKTIELLYIVKGEMMLYFGNKKKPDKILRKVKVKEGQTVKIMPNQFHWSYNEKKTIMINFLTKRFNKQKPDININ